MAVVVLVTMMAAWRQPLPVPESDSIQYLSYARSLYLANTYAATPQGPEADLMPGREPLYSFVIAMAAHIVPALAEALQRCLPVDVGCKEGFKVLTLLNAAFLSAAALMAGLTVKELGAGRLAALMSAGYIGFNFQIYKEIKYAISDFLALFLVACASWLLVKAIRRGEWKEWAMAACALAGLVLTKNIFFPFAAALLCGLTFVCVLQSFKTGLRACMAPLLAVAIFSTMCGGWMARNIAWFGAVSDDRGAIALSTREIFNHMTGEEHVAAWLWWLRGSGEDLAKELLPASAWARHSWYDANGFYMQGQFANHQERLNHVLAEHPDWSHARAASSMTGVVLAEILAEWPSYLATLPVLFYRGLWVDEFIVVGLPFLIMLSWRSVREKRGDHLVAIALGVWSLVAYPALSLNIPRYQMTALFALALAGGLGIEWLWRRYRSRRALSFIA